MMLAPPFELWQEQIYISLAGAHALFTTRRGGVSTGPYATLNLGRLTDDAPEAVERNRERVEALIGLPLAPIRQVHGTHVKRLEAQPRPDEPVENADGQATDRGGMAPAVLVADCLPIVVAGGGGLAVLHAGWRGLAGGIIREGVAALRMMGCDGPLEAAIGPGAGPCCYQVGEDIHTRFSVYGDLACRGGNLDLPAIAATQLAETGVGTVHDVGLCTICGDAAWFFSHRRDDGVTGRQAGIAWLS